MLSSKLQDAMNEQLKNEFYSAYLYLGMAGHLDSEELAGFSHFMRLQAQEEVEHAMKFFDFILEAGGHPVLAAVDGVTTEYSSPLEVFQVSLEHEKTVTAGINHLMDLAIADSNHAAQAFLQWFVTEQVEEEAVFASYVKKLQLVGDDGRGLLMLDQELGQRKAGPEGA